ncbi:bifunctional RecB family nuclease/DEAD/DEAH box helicase [Natrinema caseinilyticum]|uniref:bifunctional RecB family nuclease/DEAD/DEAH box helicase n=1 Tax=Natrinema caseinilyticum TaxID=2961570 RepID=UPI0020C2487F|nr:AAA domain-containing protein [Natrinema caseinilyticum]
MSGDGISADDRPTIHPSRIAQFYSLNQCPAYLAHEYTDEVVEQFAKQNVEDVPLSPLLEATGTAHERDQLGALLVARVHSIGPADDHLADEFDEHWSGNVDEDAIRLRQRVTERVGDPDARPLVLSQVPVRQKLKAWTVEGAADVVLVEPTARGVRVRVVEIKSATETLTHHKLQAAMYALALEKLFDDIDGVRIDASVTSQELDLASVVTATGGIELDELPRLDRRPLTNDVELLLEHGGTVDQMLHDTDGLPAHQLNATCEGCSHRAKCLAHDVVNQDLALLQLPESTQTVFREHGVTTIADVADLYEIPTDNWDRTPTNYDALEPADPSLVEMLQEEADRSDLSELAQLAHRFRRELEPAYDREWKQRADDGPWPTWLVGTGRNLPDDDPNDDSWDSEWDNYPKRSLVRVYPTVVHDHVRNRVAYLGALVTSSRYEDAGNDPEVVVARPTALPEEPAAKDDEERRLLTDFIEQLAAAVETVAPDIADEDPDYSPGDGYIHLYCWSERQRDHLVDMIKRHPDADGSPALRKLLGLRKEIDQEAVSILTAEFRERHALRYPGLGLVQTVGQFYNGDYDFDWGDTWANDEYDITEVFDQRFFKTALPLEDHGMRVMLDFDQGYTVPDKHYRDGTYPVLERHRDTLPLEYVWASEEFDRLELSDVDDEDTRERIRRYRHYDGPTSPRISLDEIDALVETICHAIHYVERSIGFKDAFTPKELITVGNLTEEAFEETALQRACTEYQQLNHGARKETLEAQYRRPLQQRVIDGDAVAFECTHTPAAGETTIRGDVIRDVGHGTSSSNTAPLSISPGDWVVVTPLEEADGRLVETPAKPEYYANSTLAVVERVDNDTVSLFSVWDDGDWPRSTDPNMTWHYGWTSDESAAADADHFVSQRGRRYDTTLIQRGKRFVVDPAVDDYAAYRSRKALANAEENVVHNRLVSVYEDHDPTALQEFVCSDDQVDEFLTAFDTAMPDEINDRQASFVREVDHTVTALQGPPGTGKTSYAAAPAVLSRAYAHGPGFNGLCAAHSNTAVDELVDDVVEALRRLETENLLEDLSLIRVRSSLTYRETPPNVTDLHYRDDREELLDLFDETMNDDSRVIVFATPVTIRNALNNVVTEKSDAHGTVEELMADGQSRLFHATLVDEASMMDLPVLFLVGAFLRSDGQLMLVGDHRQMQPIQAHDWEEEDRQPIEEHTPALSVLDFVRFLRGDVGADLSYLEREPPEWNDPDAVLPMERLTVTYRLPQPVADLETDLFYSRDDISLESGVDNSTIPDVRETLDSGWLRAALDPDPRVTLIVHDENQARRESPLEAAITRRVVDALPTSHPTESGSPQAVSAGVVVPFRLQRRRLRYELARHVQVDTVEKFQGGERDVIVLSMTAGNQGYVNALADFLLDPNRFNVGASRMRQKLVIIASKSLFRAGSTDASEYAEQKSWKLLYDGLVRGEAPAATATLDGKDVPALESRAVDLSIYTGFADQEN